jgi:hypothetical protein
MDEGREQRVAQNELAFRRANESLRTVFEEAASHEPEEAYPFLCECGERRCTEVVYVMLDTYASVRAHPQRFLIIAGHKQLDSERIVEAGDGYEIVEKSGVAGEIARAGWMQLSR